MKYHFSLWPLEVVTSQVDAQLKTFSGVLHNFLYHFLVDFFNLLPYHRRQFLNRSGFFCKNFYFKLSPKEKGRGNGGVMELFFEWN